MHGFRLRSCALVHSTAAATVRFQACVDAQGHSKSKCHASAVQNAALDRVLRSVATGPDLSSKRVRFSGDSRAINGVHSAAH